MVISDIRTGCPWGAFPDDCREASSWPTIVIRPHLPLRTNYTTIRSIRIYESQPRGGQAGSHRGIDFCLILLWLTAMGIKPLILLRFKKWLLASCESAIRFIPAGREYPLLVSPENLALIHSMIASGAFHLQLTGARFAFVARKPEPLAGRNRSVQFRRFQ